MREIELRAHACRITLAEFEGVPFDWSGASCIHLLRRHAELMGHTVPKVPPFKTALGAKRALKKLGFDSVPDLMDSMFERIPPAMMRVGDVMALEGTEGFEAIVIRAATTKFLGWHEDAPGVAVIDANMNDAKGAWRL